MIISDLSYLEAAEANVLGAGGVQFNSNVRKNVDINVRVNVQINKFVRSNTRNIAGNLATAEAGADATGTNTLSETEAYAQTGNGFSQSFSSATAGTN